MRLSQYHISRHDMDTPSTSRWGGAVRTPGTAFPIFMGKEQRSQSIFAKISVKKAQSFN